jgi:hypothetical protein
MDDHINNLYETDFYLWIHGQVEHLQAQNFEQLDLPNLIEEIEAMGRNKQHELEHRLEQLLMHLLKYKSQPDRISGSWIGTIVEQRRRINKRLQKMPSLRPLLDDFLADAYDHARQLAALETGLPLSAFPASNPFTSQQVLDVNFFP